MSTYGQKQPLPARNPITHEVHRHEVFMQITLPLLVGIAIVVGLSAAVIASGVNGNPEVSRWADISTIWLIMISLASGFFLFWVLVGFAYVVVRIVIVLPSYARLVQDFFIMAELRIRGISDKAVEPFLRSSSYKAGFLAFFRKY
jgi:hypothetical protein